jgi:hypothetical protein
MVFPPAAITRASSRNCVSITGWPCRDGPLLFKADVPPPNPLGPYQAIHRLRDETGTLRLRLTDLDGRILWEGVISTGLSPARDSAELLGRAVQVLTEQIPLARP